MNKSCHCNVIAKSCDEKVEQEERADVGHGLFQKWRRRDRQSFELLELLLMRHSGNS